MSLWRHLWWTRVFLTSEQIFKEEKVSTQHDVENGKFRKEENEKLRKNNIVKDVNIKESIQKPTEIKSFEEDKNTTDSHPNWFDNYKFKNILAIIDSNTFNYRHKTG